MNPAGSPNIRTSAAAGRAAARHERLMALQHVMALCAAGRRSEALPWLIAQTVVDDRLLGITLIQLDAALTGTSHHKAVKTLRRVRMAIGDHTDKADGYLTLYWLFAEDDRGVRLAAWLTEISERDLGFSLRPPDGFPWVRIYEGDKGVRDGA